MKMLQNFEVMSDNFSMDKIHVYAINSSQKPLIVDVDDNGNNDFKISMVANSKTTTISSV
jgi:multisubunit Na+/H+ antiporter MnhE subunit